ncbi:MAG: hypothetical protein NT015_18740 [Alphaproteobacteria bacterium]|nr:hypothetical protein [Alphaproteobacteria bacterium]
MLRGTILSLYAALLATSAAAQSQPVQPVFGPFHPPMTIEAAMAAAPEYNWQVEHSRRSDAVISASTNGLQFAGENWTVEVASDIDIAPHGYIFSFDLRRDTEVRNARACRDLLSSTVAALEPMYGAFGQHPSFDGRGTLYGGPAGSFTVVDAGASSRMRVERVGEGLQDFITFNEVDEAIGRAVMVKATYYFEHHDCELRIQDFQNTDRARRAAESRARNP